MAYISDLQPCTHLPVEDATKLLAVGWLENAHSFSVGNVSDSFFEKLCKLIRDPWQPFIAGGVHDCTLCQFSGGGNATFRKLAIPGRSGNNLFVPGAGVIFVAPVAVAHYIDAHRYQPPDEFIQAVLNCPEMKSIPYLKTILANGGRRLISSEVDSRL